MAAVCIFIASNINFRIFDFLSAFGGGAGSRLNVDNLLQDVSVLNARLIICMLLNLRMVVN